VRAELAQPTWVAGPRFWWLWPATLLIILFAASYLALQLDQGSPAVKYFATADGVALLITLLIVVGATLILVRWTLPTTRRIRASRLGLDIDLGTVRYSVPWAEVRHTGFRRIVCRSGLRRLTLVLTETQWKAVSPSVPAEFE
jgi:hypothetical protein